MLVGKEDIRQSAETTPPRTEDAAVNWDMEWIYAWQVN
jgi:hypothetical protein